MLVSLCFMMVTDYAEPEANLKNNGFIWKTWCILTDIRIQGIKNNLHDIFAVVDIYIFLLLNGCSHLIRAESSPPWPSLFWSPALLCHYCAAGWRSHTMERCWGKEQQQGEDRCVHTLAHVAHCLESVAACWSGHPSDRLYPSNPLTPRRPYPQPWGPSVWLSASPTISTLISHLRCPNELRLLVHLRDSTD